MATLWYRAEVRNMGNVPENGPVLLVGNHTGGNMSPEVTVLPLAFSTYFGVERPFYQLAHNLVLASPFGRMLRRYGTMAASHKHAEKALESGAAVLVFPGGDWEVHRPSWEGGKIDLAGRKGFIRLALDRRRADRPRGHDRRPGDRALPQPRRLAREAHRGRSQPAAQGAADLARPALGPQRRRPARPPAAAGEDHDRGAARRSTCASSSAPSPTSTRSTTYVTGVMQETLDGLAAERRFPVIG